MPTTMNEQQSPRALGKMLVGDILKSSALRAPTKEAIYCVGTGRRISYRQLNERCNRLANGLLALGLPRGTVVAFLCSNRAEIIEIYFALAKAGLVGLPLNYRLAPKEVETLVVSMGAEVLICASRFAQTGEHLRVASTGLKHTIWIGDAPPNGSLPYEGILEAASVAEPNVEVNEADPYYFNLTSGTTGLPKAYMITQYNSVTLESSMVGLDLRADDVFLTLFPAFGRSGFGLSLLAVLMCARNVLMDFDADKTLEVIRTERATITSMVSTMATLLLRHPQLETEHMKSFRAILFTGSLLPSAIVEQVTRRLCPNIYEGYGLQETGFLTVSTPEDRAARPESVGRPVLFADLRVVDAEGRDVPTGEIGEIIGRSPNTITGYLNNPEKNAEAFRDGWFHSGDLGKLDADGFVYICGRVKDMIVSGGQNVYASEVEAALLTLDGVEECAVFGLPDDTWGEAVSAVLVTSKTAFTPDDVHARCRDLLAGFKLPRKVYCQTDPLPRTPTGKVQKFLLVERYSRTA